MFVAFALLLVTIWHVAPTTRGTIQPSFLSALALYLPLLATAWLLIRHVVHCATMSAVLDIFGHGEDAIIVLTSQSRVRPRARQREWHVSEIECISNSSWDPDIASDHPRHTTLHLMLVGGKRIRFLNQLTGPERDWIASVLRSKTGLHSDFEVDPAEDNTLS